MILPHKYFQKIKERAIWKRAFVLYLDPDWKEYERAMRLLELRWDNVLLNPYSP